MSGLSSVSMLDPQQMSAILRYREIGADIAKNNQRITTLKRINSASDDPSGLISASALRSQLNGLDTLVNGVKKASDLLDTANNAAGEIVTQLQAARAIALEVAGGSLTSSEIAGKQVALDNILKGIDTLAATQFNGTRLLDGSSSYRATGVNSAQFANVQVLDKQTTSDVTVATTITTQATKAANTYAGGALGAAATVTINGTKGQSTIALANGSDTTAITNAFNAVTHLTGVVATRVDASNVTFASTTYGSAAKFSIQADTGTFTTGTAGTVSGTDAVATINGQTVTASGTTFAVTTNNTTLSIAVSPTANGALSSFTVTGKGLEYVLDTDATSKARVGLPDLNVGNLNGASGQLMSVLSGGSNSLTAGKAVEAIQILDEAISTALIGQGIVGSFQAYTLESTERVANKTKEFVGKSLNTVEGADVAVESALMANNQLLQQAALQSIQMFARQSSDVLSLLRVATLGY
jgi:flagellin-like hook-associated protein FlgL